MKKALRFLALSLALILTLSLFSLPTSAAPTGTTFTAETIYAINKAFTSDVKTVEAVLSLPTSSTGRSGAILGNFISTTATCFEFEIHENGHPRIYTVSGGRQASHIFDQVNVATGKKVHVAVAIDNAAGKMHCYVDGVLKQTLTPTYIADTCVSDTAMYLGGDPRSGNGQYFKGTLYSVAAFKDVRTANEIASDANSINTTDSNLIAAYELSGTPSTIEDKGKNNYDAKLKSKWFTDKEPVTNFDYSFAVVGDTQIVSHYAPEEMDTIYDWIIGNISKKKIKFVMGLGDIIDWYQNDPSGEWNNAAAAIKQMDGKVPYSLCRGNHDGANDFNKYFPYSEYKNKVGGTYDNTSIINSWQKFEVNGIKYMVFTLDYGANDSVLNWASDLIAQNPTYNVIITTHAYLYRDGSTLDDREACPPSTSGGTNDGDDIWNKLISKHENIVMVLSGHDPCDRIVLTQTKGKNGTVVSQFLIDPQGVDLDDPTGLVAIFHFSNNGSRVTVEYYSPIKQQYFMEENQFSFDLAVIDPPKTPTSTSTSTTTKPTTTTSTKASSATSSKTNTSAGTQQSKPTTSISNQQSNPSTAVGTQANPSTSMNSTQPVATGGQQPAPSQNSSEPVNTSPSMSNATQNGENVTASQTEPSASAGGTTRPSDNSDPHESDNSLTWILIGGALIIVGGFITACLLLTSKKKKQ